VAVGVTKGGPAVIAPTGAQKQRANRQSNFGPTCRLVSSPEAGLGAIHVHRCTDSFPIFYKFLAAAHPCLIPSPILGGGPPSVAMGTRTSVSACLQWGPTLPRTLTDAARVRRLLTLGHAAVAPCCHAGRGQT
jgi:hypothetical protein